MKLDEKDFKDDYIVKKIGSGATATCYLTKDGKVYKKFFGNIDYDRLYLKFLTNFDNPNITFPKQLVYNDNELVGYIRNFAPGIEIDFLDENVNIKRFVEAIKDLEENIYDTFFSIMFTDLSGENLVYDEKENKITIIDTDYFEPIESFEQMMERRNLGVNSFIENKKWLVNSFDSFFKEAIKLGGEINKYISEGFDGLIYIYFTLQKVIELLENETNKVINTIGDYKNAIMEVKEKNNVKTRI